MKYSISFQIVKKKKDLILKRKILYLLYTKYMGNFINSIPVVKYLFETKDSKNFLSRYSKNYNYMILGPSTIDGINGKPDTQFDINKTRKLPKKSFSLHYNHINSYLFVNGKAKIS